MRWRLWLGLALLLPAALAGEPVSGHLLLDDALVVSAGETLTLLAGTSITGRGHIDVFGSLESLGNDTARVEISVPVLLAGNGTSRLEDTRLWGVSGTALTLRSGNLTMANVTFEGNGVGLAVIAPGDARITGDRVTFRAHASEGARVQGASRFDLSRSNFSEDLRGLVLDLGLDTPMTARINDSTFYRNGEHVDVVLGSASAPADVRFVRDDLGATSSPAGIARPGLWVHSDLGPQSPGAASARNVTSVATTYHDADVAVRLEGAGYHFTSQGDRFTANRIGLAVGDASAARVIGSSFDDREKDVETNVPANVLAEGATFSASRATVPGPAPAPVTSWWLPVGALGATVVAAGGAAVWRARRQRLIAARARSAVPPPDLAAPLRPMERRVLDDIVAHPGTAQAAVALRLGLTRQALHYHVKKLEARRLLTKSTSGRETRCTVPDEVARALGLSPPPVTHAGDVEKG